MKKLATVLVIITIVCTLQIVSYAIPIAQNNFYINDYAELFTVDEKDDMLKMARDVYDKTNVKVVLLTVASTDGEDIDDYAKAVFTAWNIDDTGELIVAAKDKNEITAYIPSGETKAPETREIAGQLAKEGRLAEASRLYFYALAEVTEASHAAAPANPDQATTQTAAETAANADGGISLMRTFDEVISEVRNAVSGGENGFLAVSVLLVLLVMMRGVMVSAKYRKKYNKPYVYKHRQFTNTFSRTEARSDDLDYPSGFGGLGNRALFFGDENDTNGIIVRKDDDDYDSGDDD